MSGLPTAARTLLGAAVTATMLVVGTPSTGHAAARNQRRVAVGPVVAPIGRIAVAGGRDAQAR